MHNKISVAPMLDWTNRHCRYLHRLISKNVLLYTEMVTTSALKHSDHERHLAYNHIEHPVVLQLGGSNVKELTTSCEVAQEYGYDQVNLNVGCPSDRVQQGRFGACLMNEPELVQDCVGSMISAVDIPITIKCRIGVDNNDSFENLQLFVDKIASSGVQTIIVHARKALLKGLSPKQNRSIPPLNYDYVYRIKQLFPDLEIIINGGINTLDEVKQHLKHVDGVMLGRAVWNNPWLLNILQNEIYGQFEELSRDIVLEKYKQYCGTQVKNGAKLHWLLPPILNLYHGIAGNKKWKSHLVSQAQIRVNDLSIFNEAHEYINYG